MACPNCGSWAVRSDRSLAGRMVCVRCGQPLGIAAGAQGRRRRVWGQALGTHRWPDRWRLWLGLTTLLAVSGVLAALPQRSWTPAPPDRDRVIPWRNT